MLINPVRWFATAMLVILVAIPAAGGASPAADLSTFANIAHRGASGHAPEETMQAFEQAVQAGADYLELDVQMTSDGHLVATHDTTIDRTTDGEGKLGEHTLAQLKELDAGSWFNRKHPDRADDAYAGAKLLTLDEIIEHFGADEKYYIETKSPQLYPGVEKKLVEILESHDLIAQNRVVLQSFRSDSLKRLHALNSDIPLVRLVWYSSETEGGDFEAIGEYADGIGTNYVNKSGREVISSTFVHKAHEADLFVHVYTINDETVMNRLMDWGVDGIFTNFPDRLATVRDNRSD
ncbi:glycerophosphodiester phosphodiesterase [Salinisphaera sp. USBA-960]|uniref:glycerophosphodiester phosphodiesterase n=1 Tax=Salinisphaera orenii TaxID=856731 RepID=UPI000DBE7FAB|nr:glycerophosphodiester phosphodiesterase [Salifodinibacter halophilus]NNC26603.1 glycerophosphodiester phosphodiesterase [Salifodinibacter halophilus]